MRDFYVYGFRSRDEFDKKSGRSYDDERRRIESWVGDYMNFRRTADGKNVFISIDSRAVSRNPLYNAWKAKSFTDGDITLHFILFDILSSPEKKLSISEIIEEIDEKYLSIFPEPMSFDESTVRKKLSEYEKEGLVIKEKEGRGVKYRRASDVKIDNARDALDFFSEVMPCGAVGSFLLDKLPTHESVFGFKHHYITHVMDSEILCSVFDAIRSKSEVEIERVGGGSEKIVPLKVLISARSGRQYIMHYNVRTRRIESCRADRIQSVKKGEICAEYDALRESYDKMRRNIWGVMTGGKARALEHVEFTVRAEDDEKYIVSRLEREKRCGTVEKLSDNLYRFSADVYDSAELVPWMRTYICRITSVSFSNKDIERRFLDDLREMYSMYGTEE